MNGEIKSYVDKMDTNLYFDFTTNEIYFKDPFIFTLVNGMKDTCDNIQGKQYRKLRDVFVPFCLELHDRYYFNILRMITILCRTLELDIRSYIDCIKIHTEGG